MLPLDKIFLEKNHKTLVDNSLYDLLTNNTLISPPSYNNLNVNVARPSLPPLIEFLPYLENIWKSGHITNDGNYHKEFENKLAKHLDVSNMCLLSNGTLALLLALKSLKLKGEIITTPYSFIATTHVIKWNGLKPVFCDIDEKTLNIDASKIESLISNKTEAILATNVYGMPCDFKLIKKIADKYNLRIIYDSAHAFGVKENGKSILTNGDISILSFHGTKVFTTFEGGAIIAKDKKIKEDIDSLKNFAIKNEEVVDGLGINAKMNEFQAALGLLQLKYIKSYIKKRSVFYNIYMESIRDIQGIKTINFPKNIDNNYSYFPILISKNKYGKSRDELFNYLLKNEIFARKYFYPLISNFPLYSNLKSSNKTLLPVANKISSEIICLPMHTHLRLKDVYKIVKLIRDFSRS